MRYAVSAITSAVVTSGLALSIARGHDSWSGSASSAASRRAARAPFAESALKDERRDAAVSDLVGEQRAVLLPLTEDEAASTAGERTENVVADERSAFLVFDDQSEELVDRHPGRTGDCDLRLAHHELEVDVPRRTFAACVLVPNRTALHRDDLLQTVAPVRVAVSPRK
jgi:hypothetical protein